MFSKRPAEPDFDYEEIMENENTEAYFSEGIQRLRNNENKAAALLFQKALIIEPGNADAFYYLGLAQQRIGQLDTATENYSLAIENDPSLYEAIFNLAAVHSVQKNYHLALDQYEKGLSIYPQDSELHYNMGLCYEQMGKAEEAVIEYGKSYQFEPNMLEARLRSAAIFESQGKTSAAVNEYQKILQISPNSQVAKKKLELLTLKEEKVSEIDVGFDEIPEESSEKETGIVKKVLKGSKSTLGKVISYPKKLFKRSDEPKREEPVSPMKSIHFSLNTKFVMQKDVSFEENEENENSENSINSKRAIVRLGYTPQFLNRFFLRDTQIYLNLGSVSMSFDEAIEDAPLFEKAMAFAYGAGLRSNILNLPPLGINLNFDYLKYAPEVESTSANSKITATADLTEYYLAADGVYKGFQKFFPYLGILYSNTSGNFELSGSSKSDFDKDFNEKEYIGYRIGTDYDWTENIRLTGEYRMMDENALSLLVNYSF